MKSYISLTLLLSSLFALNACTEKDPFQTEVVDKSSVELITPIDGNINFDDNEGTFVLTFETIAGWRAEFVNDRAVDWCSLGQERGKGGENQLEVIVTKNTAIEERSASFKIISGVASKTLIVTQKPSNSILLSSSRLEVEPEGGTVTLTAKANMSCTASVPQAYSSWIEVVETRATQTSMSFSIKQNESFDIREGRIDVKTDNATESVTVYQKGVTPVIVLSTTRVDLPSSESEFVVDVTSNVNVSIKMPDVDWVKESASKSTSTNSYSFAVSENQTTQARTAVISFYNTERNITQDFTVVQAGQKGKDAIRILAIGNSFSDDSMWYLYNILEQVGYNSIKLANLYIGGCTLETHAKNIESGAKAYTYRVNTDGTWTSTDSYNAIDAIKSDSWDYISVQQASGSSGMQDTFDPYLATIVNEVKKDCPDAKLVWNMTWAYQGNSTHSEFAKYDKSQSKMYNEIVATVKSKILTNNDFKMVIPVGTAIQNLRTSLYGDNVTRDGYHLSYDAGRLTAAIMWAKQLTGCDLDKITWKPSGYIFTDKRYAAIKESVKNAYENSYAVTESEIKQDDVNPNSSLSELVKAAGYDPDLYNSLAINVTKVAYYNSANGNANIMTNMSNYAATQVFSKSEIPNGSLIVIKEGYQYRPEGWTELNVKTSPRPDNVTAQVVLVDDAWWREFNYRAFNLAKKGNPKLSDAEQEELTTVFGIFTPKNDMDVAFREAGYKIKDYSKLTLDIKTYAYYNSSANSSLGTNMKNYAATRIFSKDEIPVGSVIIQKEGHQYRPEGWTALDVKTKNRPGNVTEQIVVVDEAWWGSFNFRAFNLALKGNPKLNDEQQAELKTAFAIYVPIKK